MEKDGRPGVWFLSLDADNALAVWAARRFYHLPYHRARMRITTRNHCTHLESSRETTSGPVRFKGSYRPASGAFEAAPGSIDHFLAENYRLYCQSPAGILHSIDVHHAPWPLRKAEAELETGNLVEAFGLRLEGPPTHLHFSQGVDVIAWPMQRA